MKNLARKTADTPASITHDVIAQMIDRMVLHAGKSDDLETLARTAGYDPTHFHKVFTARVGVTPKQFTSYLQIRAARDVLGSGGSIEKAAAKINLNSTARLYDLFNVTEAILPGDITRRGAGLDIRYGWHATRLGDLLIGLSPRGICYLGFQAEEKSASAETRMRRYFPAAHFIPEHKHTGDIAKAIDARWFGGERGSPLPLDIHGTNFQLMVWQALLRIPNGALVSYHDVARAIKRPNAPRAVGTAVGSNPISLLIPCHRVIQSSGIIENYGWGSDRKRVLIGIECAT